MMQEEELVFIVRGEERKYLLHTPERLCGTPTVLVQLAADRRSSLDAEDMRRVPDIFLAAGHRVASFDLPNHGERADKHGKKLDGMASAVAAGEDVFADIRETGKALLDSLAKGGFLPTGSAVFNGISRGGLSALHVMAVDARVLACALHAPVTNIPTLREFSALADNPIIRRANAASLVEFLADRPIFIAIGCRDPRVGAEHCFDFHARLCAASQRTAPVLFTIPGQSHAKDFPSDVGYHAAAAFLLEHHAAAARSVVRAGIKDD